MNLKRLLHIGAFSGSMLIVLCSTFLTALITFFIGLQGNVWGYGVSILCAVSMLYMLGVVLSADDPL